MRESGARSSSLASWAVRDLDTVVLQPEPLETDSSPLLS